jgi:FkbM family methyltransferase
MIAVRELSPSDACDVRGGPAYLSIFWGIAISLRQLVKPLIPDFVLKARKQRNISAEAASFGVSVRYGPEFIEAVKGSHAIRLSYRNEIYLVDCVTFFDFFFEAVKPFEVGERKIADFSTPRFHEVVGFDDFPVQFPSIPEPHVTLDQYLSFAGLKDGDIVLDLGVYAGLSSIVFSRTVGAKGQVFGFEADKINFGVATRNLELARRFGLPANVLLVPKAVWSHEDGLEFSAEGAMGSSAVSLVGRGRGSTVKVSTTTLEAFCSEQGLDRLDFIKIDIEGAEVQVLESSQRLLSRFRPRMIIEPHLIGGQMTADRCRAILKDAGYATRVVDQAGARVPLIEAWPN